MTPIRSVRIDATADGRLIASIALHASTPEADVEALADRSASYFDVPGFGGANVAARIVDRVLDIEVENLRSEDLVHSLQLFAGHLRKAVIAAPVREVAP